MKLGVSYPTAEVPVDHRLVRRFCRDVEALGFDHLAVYDHVLKCPHDGRDPPLTGPYTEKDRFHDPFVLLTFAAAVTEKLSLGTSVLVLPQRQTALVAQQAADLDLLSQERLRLGVGIGWNHVEYSGLGQDFRTRARRLEEQVDLLRQLWTVPVLSFQGQFDTIDRAGINPRPRRTVPLWLGGKTPVAYQRAARIGDGFIFADTGRGALAARAQILEARKALGREEGDFGYDLLTLFARGASEAAGHVRTFREGGGTHATLASMGKGLGEDIAAHIAWLAEVKRLIERG